MMNEIKNTSVIDRPICLLLGALGGQGGGVLIEWLVDAAKRAGYPAQATSTPGVAQRTGATTYYFELFPEKNPAGTPIFTFFPASGDLDLMIAMEPTEAGRAIERGFVTDCTTVITATERVYSTAEKVSAGDGRIDVEPILEAIEKASKELLQLDMAALSAGTAARGNAIAFGAIVSSGILPLTAEDCRASITSRGVAVESNLAGFEIGLTANATDAQPNSQKDELIFNAAPEKFASKISDFPSSAQEIIGHGIARLIDYQNEAYAEFYLERLKSVAEADTDESKKLTSEVARHLARWMSFEDVIRVAQLKTRPERLSRIRGELSVDDTTPLKVTDYFKPGRDEFLGALPKGLGWLVPNIEKLKLGNGLALHLPTGSAFGYAMLKFMAALKPLRSKSAQYIEEQAAIEQWLAAVIKAAATDNYLACQTANLAILARGYGQVRKTGFSKMATLFSGWAERLTNDHAGLAAEVDQMILLAHANPEET
jgi:indolepyruvate ferredoxin oxidoreductase beta subunit